MKVFVLTDYSRYELDILGVFVSLELAQSVAAGYDRRRKPKWKEESDGVWRAGDYEILRFGLDGFQERLIRDDVVFLRNIAADLNAREADSLADRIEAMLQPEEWHIYVRARSSDMGKTEGPR